MRSLQTGVVAPRDVVHLVRSDIFRDITDQGIRLSPHVRLIPDPIVKVISFSARSANVAEKSRSSRVREGGATPRTRGTEIP